ncbi:HD domain-containing protein [Candidatus Bathyarchaeota archaeon]|jgi:uncharacterized protein|nr:HD domain-containing protein [Candidatus Bathyarchaeota archaeon]
MNDIITKLLEISKRYHEIEGSHGFEHTERVIKLTKFLGKKLNANMDILLPAAILHDIARAKENHALIGSRISEDILKELKFKEEKINSICSAIETHSFSAGRKAESIEAKILSDADKLDALGAIGIYRTATYSGENSKSFKDFLAHFDDKLLKLKNLMYTDEAYKIALARHNYMLEFLEKIKQEIDISDFNSSV